MFVSTLKIKLYKSILIIGIFITGMFSKGFCQQSEKSVISILSFNVRYNTPKDGINAWPFRKEKVAEVIISNDIDIAGLQEPWKDQIRDLKEVIIRI